MKFTTLIKLGRKQGNLNLDKTTRNRKWNKKSFLGKQCSVSVSALFWKVSRKVPTLKKYLKQSIIYYLLLPFHKLNQQSFSGRYRYFGIFKIFKYKMIVTKFVIHFLAHLTFYSLKKIQFLNSYIQDIARKKISMPIKFNMHIYVVLECWLIWQGITKNKCNFKVKI